MLLGYLVGFYYYPPHGGFWGAYIAFSIFTVWSVINYLTGDSTILLLNGAKKISHDTHPQLFNIVEEMKIAANLSVMPNVYVIPSRATNAFATGIRSKNNAVAVTAGLLWRLDRDELQGVIAHEMSHILNRDTLFVSFAGVMLGSIILLSEAFLRETFWSLDDSSRRYDSRNYSGGGWPVIIMIHVFAALSPIIARLFYFALSRKREYLADASAVRLTRYPEGLASALEKISKRSALDPSLSNKITTPMLIASPEIKSGWKFSSLTNTHPPIAERINILRAMIEGVDYPCYQQAFSRVGNSKETIFPESQLIQYQNIPIRQANEDKDRKENKKKEFRKIGDLIRVVNKYAFLTCYCGLKFKIPPNFKKQKILCPKCMCEVKIPFAELAGIDDIRTAVGFAEKKKTSKQNKKQLLTYKRKTEGWESFSCACGRLLQISPAFIASHIICQKCGRKTVIEKVV
jgi:heat shock protein HtpX